MATEYEFYEPLDEECPDCGVPLQAKPSRYNYITIFCPECEKWKRPGQDALRDPPDE